MEKVITCPVCLDTDHCFEDVQEQHSSYLCFKCGYMSDSRYTVGSLELADSLKKSSGKEPFCTFVNEPSNGIVYLESKKST